VVTLKIDGNLIRLLRHEVGMSQAKFAKTLGVATATVANVEVGYRPASDALKIRLIRTFDLTEEKIAALKQIERVVFS
jgi:DNA-binding XRE family transcriptional regulator